jgi:arylsulfatase A-like enzyme
MIEFLAKTRAGCRRISPRNLRRGITTVARLTLAIVIPPLLFTPSLIAESGDRPNVVVILADDLGCCDMALYDGWVKTPRIQQMAAQGMRFTDFHANSSVCSPTRAAFLTGRYQQRVGIVDVIVGSREPDSGIPPSIPTLPRVFHDNGYTTALFGKWHCGYQDQYNPLHHGFDEFVGFLNGATDYHQHGAWLGKNECARLFDPRHHRPQHRFY